MACLLGLGLVFRWASYSSSVKEDAYFTTFVSEVEKQISEEEGWSRGKVEDVDKFLFNLLNNIKEKLPTRSIRDSFQKKDLNEKFGAKKVVSLREYVTGDQGLFYSIKTESGAFKSTFPPNYYELTERILERDDSWTKIKGLFPIAPIARLNDILPSLFVVFGIFGTFIGISMALPEIAKIDFNNLDASGEILTRFVLSVTYAMKTSIAGIMFSLIMTFLNTLAPVQGTRDKTFKKVSNCFENIWIAIHGKKTDEEMKDLMPIMVEELKNIRTLLQNEDDEKKEVA
jgi:hypothetical protein